MTDAVDEGGLGRMGALKRGWRWNKQLAVSMQNSPPRQGAEEKGKKVFFWDGRIKTL